MIPDLPAPILSTSRDPKTARHRVATLTGQELQIIKGKYYVGSSIRLGVASGDTNYAVIKAPADRFLIIEDAITDLSFQAVVDGRYTITIDGFIQGSPSNEWSFTPVDPKPAGTPLNTELAKDLANYPTSTVDLSIGTVVPTNLSIPDYPLLFTDYFIDVSGNRENISTTGSSFFEAGRQIIIPPNNEILIRTVTSGGATGTADIRTIFFTSEIGIDEAPAILGINP